VYIILKIEKGVLMEEIWKDIEGYEKFYQVSNFGRIKSLNRIDSSNHRICEKILKLKKRKNYLGVDLHKNGELRTYSVHRLVAQAFIPNPDNKPQVNHIDEDKYNNQVNNLEWCTVLYNNTYGTRMERQISSKNTPIYGFTNKPYYRKIWFSSISKATDFIDGDQTGISHVLRGRYKTHKGWSFKYASDIEK